MNHAADALSKIRSSRAQIPQGVFIQDIIKPSVGGDLVKKENSEALLVHNIQNATPTTSNTDLRAPFIKYLTDGTALQDKT
jgi:hypothetical protein